MKKIYSTPQIRLTLVGGEGLLQSSGNLEMKTGEITREADVLVKERNNGYNVWKDDWSN